MASLSSWLIDWSWGFDWLIDWLVDFGSHQFGQIPRGLIVAKVSHVVWPPRRWGKVRGSETSTDHRSYHAAAGFERAGQIAKVAADCKWILRCTTYKILFFAAQFFVAATSYDICVFGDILFYFYGCFFVYDLMKLRRAFDQLIDWLIVWCVWNCNPRICTSVVIKNSTKTWTQKHNHGWKMKWTTIEAWKRLVSNLAMTRRSVSGSHSCRVETMTSWWFFCTSVTKYPYL